MSGSRRIVITGMGVLTSSGQGLAAFEEALWAGRSGLGPITHFSTGAFACTVAGEVAGFDGAPLDRASRFAVQAAREALEHAGLTPDAVPASELGVVVGTTCGGILSVESVVDATMKGLDPERIEDWRYRELPLHAATRHVAAMAEAAGPVLTATVACAAGTHAVGVAADLIRRGRCAAALAGGVDVISRSVYRGFTAFRGLGQLPYRAFDTERTGMVLGEGAGFFVLEEREAALRRGAPILAEVLGHAATNDATHVMGADRSGEGLTRALRAALRCAGLSPEAVDHVNAHGAGSSIGDAAESSALHAVLGEAAGRVPVTSIKPMVGHTSGASGAIELVASVLSLQRQRAPATLNLQTPDPECPLSLSAAVRDSPMQVVVSQSVGVGGSNAVIVVGGPEAPPPPAAAQERVVVTGTGVLLPGAEGTDALWERLAGAPALADGAALRTPSVALFERLGISPTRETRRMDPFSMLALAAAHQALRSAGLADRAREVGLCLGSGEGSLASLALFAEGLSRPKVDPLVYQNTTTNAVVAYLSMLLGLHGSASAYTHGWVGGAMAVAQGADQVASGRAPAMLGGGAEHVCDVAVEALRRTGCLSRDRGSHPYSRRGRGLVPADGAAFLMLESASAASARGATPVAELLGSGMRSAAGASAEDAVLGAAREALAAVPAGALHIIGSGTGVADLDRAELAGLGRALDALGRTATLSAVTGAIGHGQGCSGASAAVCAVEALARGAIPGTVRRRGGSLPSPIALLDAPKVARPDVVLVSSLDADGSATCLAFGRPTSRLSGATR